MLGLLCFKVVSGFTGIFDLEALEKVNTIGQASSSNGWPGGGASSNAAQGDQPTFVWSGLFRPNPPARIICPEISH
jgi:hypothetical protein